MRKKNEREKEMSCWWARATREEEHEEGKAKSETDDGRGGRGEGDEGSLVAWSPPSGLSLPALSR
jgi:hypothetical protein